VSNVDRYLPPLTERQTRWARFAAVIAAALLLAWITLRLRTVITPIVAGLAIAYILNPVVTYLESRLRVRRVVSVGAGILFLLALGAIGLLAGITQLIEFGGNIPTYAAKTQDWINDTLALWNAPPATAAASASAPASEPTAALFSVRRSAIEAGLKYGRGIAEGAVAVTLAWITDVFQWLGLLVFVPIYAFFFLLNFNSMCRGVHDHLPAAYRPTIVDVVRTIDSAVANFFRGRLMVCALIAISTGIGWTLVGVKYGIVLGATAGILSLVPFMSILVVPPAVILAYLSATQAGQPWAVPVVLAIAVYMAVQALESLVFSPIIESRTSGLHPLATVVALLIGNEVAGLLGMLLAIPLASTLKSLASVYLMPEVRRLAGITTAPIATAEPYPVTDAPAPKENP
jgi:predicted PurR-regulated permease PerM